MAYGFKLAGITIPDDTISINVVISDGTTPTEYTLTGSVADGFGGTGASLSVPVIKLDDDAAVITANSGYAINAEVSAWFEGLTVEELKRNEIYVNGIRLPLNEQVGVYLYTDGDIAYGVVPPREGGERATFEVINESEVYVPGTYHLVIYDGPATSNLTINALTAGDVGDSYNVNVYATKVTQSFKTAVEMVLEESGGSSSDIKIVHFTYSDTDGAACDATFEELNPLSGLNANTIFLYNNSPSFSVAFSLHPAALQVQFASNFLNYIYVFTLASDNTVTYQEYKTNVTTSSSPK